MKDAMSAALLTNAEMARADSLAVQAGIAVDSLMHAAGCAVATVVGARFPHGEVLVLCGPGNNGGDGFVAARHLAASGWPVRCALIGDRHTLGGAARWAAQLWEGEIEAVRPELFADRPLVVDALFGAGLSRPLDGMARETVEQIARQRLQIVAIDVPSGMSGDNGFVLGAAARAQLTVTFHRAKPGHHSLQGRILCGELKVVEIGIPRRVMQEVAPRQWINRPALWRRALREETLDDHKYSRGHAAVLGGEVSTGAARLAALTARRIGAGLVSVLATPRVTPVYQIADPGNLVVPFDPAQGIGPVLADARKNALLLGPGAGLGDQLRRLVGEALATGRPTVLDADALTVFAGKPQALFDAIRGPCVLTPHDGEFARLFPDLPPGLGKLERVRRAAARAGATVLLKGADTTIAAPDGRAVINDNAPPTLATAGSGDVLAGLIVGQLAQGMAPLAAAASAVWIHGDAASRFGPGLIAEDIIGRIPAVLAELRRPTLDTRG